MSQRFPFRYFRSDNLIIRYGMAVVSILAVLLIRLLLHPMLGNRSQYIVFLLAVLITAWFSGTVPALIALALGAFLGNFFFVEPYLHFKIEDLTDVVAVSFYIVVGAAIVYIFEMLKRREQQLAAQIVKQAGVEKALRMSEERFRLATEALHGLVYDVDLITGETYRSSGLYRVLGYQPDQVPRYRTWWQDQIQPEDLEIVQRNYQKTIAAHAPLRSDEYRIRHKDGHYLWVWDNCRILYDAGGQPIRMIGTTLSIDERKRLTESLTRSEDRFRLVTEALEGAIYDWDAITGVAYRSPGLYEIVGYLANEVPNTRQWWQEQMHPDDFANVQQSLAQMLAQRAPTHSVEYRVRHKDGHYLWVWDKSRILYASDGQLTRLIGITLSIDERKTLADSLAQTEERFRVAFESASDAMALSDAQGIVVAANQAYFQLYGYSAQEVIGHNYAIIYPEDARQHSIERYQQVFNDRRELSFYESTVRRKDGSVRIVEARTGFVEMHGQRMYLLSVVRDLTDRKQNENALYARYQLTAELVHAATPEEVAQVAVDQLIDHLGANAGTIYIYHPEDDTFELLYASAVIAVSEHLRPWRRFPAQPGYPITDVVKHNQSLWFSSTAETEAAYPFTQQFSNFTSGANIRLPLVGSSEVFGSINIIFPDVRPFTEDEKNFITSLVFQCAQVIERARLGEKAQALAVIEERHRLARDLHDNVSQLLFSSSVISEMLPRLLTNKPDKALQQAEQLHLMVRGAMAEMRTLLWELRPENITQTQLSGLLTQLVYAAQSRQEAKVSLDVHADHEFLLPADAQVAFYRIAQEGLHNVLKHGQAAAISVMFRQTPTYTVLVITDKGPGFDTTVARSGFGLRNMQERATNIDARFDIKSQLGKGTRLRLLWTPPA